MCLDRRTQQTRARRLQERQARWPSPTDGWEKQAACRAENVNPHWFFSETTGPAAANETLLALRICARCPAKADCLRAALHGDEQGVWGGTTYRERRRMLYLPSDYVLPLRAKPRADHLARLCWCARERVEVHRTAARQGITRSCGHPDCGPSVREDENANVSV